MVKNSKSDKWFKPVRGSYLPNNWKGWLTYLPFLAYLAFAVVFGAQYADNTMQAILLIVPNWIAATVVMAWVAAHAS